MRAAHAPARPRAGEIEPAITVISEQLRNLVQ